MAIKFTAVRCPECGANLPIEEGRTQMYCSYCGTSIIMTNENEHIVRHIDEAEIKQAEARQAIELKKIEFAEKKRKTKEKHRKAKIVISILLGIVSLAFLAIGYTVDDAIGLVIAGMFALVILAYMWIREINGNSDDDDDDFGEKIRIPRDAVNCIGKNYASTEARFRSAGFTNVTCIPLHDLKVGIIYRPNMVESITIGSRDIHSAKKKYSPNVKIVITYHSYA